MGWKWLGRLAILGASLVATPSIAQPAFPDIPPAPAMDDRPYPECKYAYRERNLARYRAEEASQCIERLDGYYEAVLSPFEPQVTAHGQALDALRDLVSNARSSYDAAMVDRYLARIEAQREGADMAAYREADARYRDDRAFLEERFCRYAECEDYELTALTTERDIDDGMYACGDGPGDTIFFEGMFGRLLNWARGIPTNTGVADAIVRIGCSLEPEERRRAAEARDRAAEQDEVGATAQWTSETRPDVSGSSTVTARNSQPNGSTCLEITDVVIIDGEEVRAARTMCREAGGSRYVLRS